MNPSAALTSATNRVFPTLPSPDRYFPAQSIEEARLRLHACISRGDGPAIVIGPAGSGKTMLLEVVAHSARDRFLVAAISGPELSSGRSLLQALLSEVDLPYLEREESELRLTLHEALRNRNLMPNGLLVLVDEAQGLSAALLEELRVLSNVARQGVPLVRLVLFGGPDLEDAFAAPELDALNQRVAARCYLSSMSFDETREYVRAHVAAAGADPDQVFTPGGLDAVFHASDGVPRLVSQIADRAVATAIAGGHETIDAAVIQDAWSDLHQLPTPWTPVSDHQQQKAEAVEPAVEPDEQDTATIEHPASDAQWENQFPEIVGDDHVKAHATADDAADRTVADTEIREPAWTADKALNNLLPTIATMSEADQPPVTVDPFGEGFDEEELVIDRFAPLDTMLTSGSPSVTNTVDPDLSFIAGALLIDQPDTADQNVDAARDASDIQAQPEEGIAAAPQPPVKSQPKDDEQAEPECQTLQFAEPVDDGSDILVIESDLEEVEGLSVPTVRRREYRQLFAQLRQG